MNKWARDWWAKYEAEREAEPLPTVPDLSYTPDPKIARRHKARAYSKRNIHGDHTINPQGGYKEP